MGTELSPKNKIQATGSLAGPVLRYGFGNVNWHQEELQKLDRKARKLLTIHGHRLRSLVCSQKMGGVRMYAHAYRTVLGLALHLAFRM